MFSKEKGRALKILNGFLLIMLIIYAIGFLSEIIQSLLPYNGDYSNFVLSDFIYNIIKSLGDIAIIGIILWLLNNKINLFDSIFAFSRKLFNWLLVISIVASANEIFHYVLDLIFKKSNYIFDIKTTIVYTIVSILYIYIVNSKPILSTQNSKYQNCFSYIAIMICFALTCSFLLTILDIGDFEHPVDFLRTLLIQGTSIGVFTYAIYYINFKKKKTEKQEIQN